MNSITDRYAGPGVIIASFAVYLLTSAPEVTFWDSGELIMGALSLGIPHPPAYPTFCMLGKVFSLLPFGNAAHRINLMSGIFGSLTAYVLYLLARRICGPGPFWTPFAASAALLFAFTLPVWSQSVVAEIYTINSLLLACIAYMLHRHHAEGRESYLHASAFILGLALVTHQSAVFLVPVFILYYGLAKGPAGGPRRAALSVFFFLLGLSTLLYVPVRASAGPMINVGDPEVMFWFLWVVKLSEHVNTFLTIPDKMSYLVSGSIIPAAAVAAACVAVGWALRKRAYVLFLIFAAASYYIGMKVLTAGYEDIVKWGLLTKFFIPTVLFAVPLAAMAFSRVLDPALKNISSVRLRAAIALMSWALLLVPAGAVHRNLHDCDNSRNYFAFDFATNTLKSTMQDGALFAWGDNGVFPVWYLKGWERYREDAVFMHTELLTHSWYMSGVMSAVELKFGVDFSPPAALSELRTNVSALRAELEKVTPVYLDYSAAAMLNQDIRKMKPQGLIHLTGPWRFLRLERIWDMYVLRGAFDGTTNKAFAAEGILSIYSYECSIWAQHEYARGRLREALDAYELMTKLGTRNEYLDKWAQGIRQELREKQNK